MDKEEKNRLMKLLGGKLRKLRIEKNLTQSEVAKMNGINKFEELLEI